MPELLQGLLTAMVTPFSDDGESVDENRLRSLVDRLIDGGVDGIVAVGTTGEFPTLSDDERRQVVEIVCSHTGGHVPVVAQTGALSTKQAVGLTRHAAASGAAAVLVIPPFYGPLSDDGYRAYYSAVAEAADLPIIAYNLPSGTGKHFTAEWLAALAQEIPNVEYVKESSGDFGQIGRLARDYSDEIKVLNGLDTMHLPALGMGAVGSILGGPNVVTREQAAVTAAFRDGRHEDAFEIFHKIYPLLEFFLSTPHFASGVKGVLQLIGESAGPSRAPGHPLSADARERVQPILDRLGLVATAV